MMKKLSKEKIKNRTYSNKFNNNIMSESIIVKEKDKDLKYKYNALYSKYLQLNNDFKYLNNNNSFKELNQIKYKYKKLQEEYIFLQKLLEQKNKLIQKQKKRNR